MPYYLIVGDFTRDCIGPFPTNEAAMQYFEWRRNECGDSALIGVRAHVISAQAPISAHNETPPPYGPIPTPISIPAPRDETASIYEDSVIQRALEILASRLKHGNAITSPQSVKDYLQLALAGAEHEQFAVLFLDAQHHTIAFDVMFRGTLTQTSVYPREVVKAALAHNASAVILSHNHPSGHAEPSRADEYLTTTLKQALALVDVRVLDHVVVSATNTVSMAERGLL